MRFIALCVAGFCVAGIFRVSNWVAGFFAMGVFRVGGWVIVIWVMGDPAGLLTWMKLMKWQLGLGQSVAEQDKVASCVADGTGNAF